MAPTNTTTNLLLDGIDRDDTRIVGATRVLASELDGYGSKGRVSVWEFEVDLITTDARVKAHTVTVIASGFDSAISQASEELTASRRISGYVRADAVRRVAGYVKSWGA